MKLLTKQHIWGLALALALSGRAQTVKFSGVVVDREGKPVAGATVDCYQYPASRVSVALDTELKQHATTDEKGGFEFSLPPAQSILLAHKAGLAYGWRQLLPTPGALADSLVLAAPTVLAGTVVDEKEQPVADAEVWVSVAITDRALFQPGFLTGKPARDAFSVKTSADGHFRLENFPAGAEANLNAHKPGRTQREIAAGGGNGINVSFHAGQENIKLVLEPAGGIAGKVVAESGQGVSGVTLALQRISAVFNGTPNNEPVESGTDGAFQFKDVPAGSYRVIPVQPGETMPDWVAESVPAVVASGKETKDIRIAATKGGVVEVLVRSKTDQKPVSGMMVSSYSETFQAAGQTDEKGVARLRLPAGQFNFSAYREGWSQSQNSGSVQAGQTNRIDVETEPSPKIRGLVTDDAGKPAAGVRMMVTPNYGGNSATVTDATGHYELSWQMPNFGPNVNFSVSFALVALDSKRNLSAMHDFDQSTTNLDLRLQPGVTLAARVQDAGGKPIAGASVYLMVWSGNSSSSINQAQTDADGRLEIKGMPQGRHYGLSINAKGYGSANNLQAQENETAVSRFEFPPIVLKLADRKLAGQVLGTDGKPMAGVMVNLNGEGQPNGNANTDAEGHFKFDVCDGPLSVYANYQGQFANIQANGGDTNVVLRLGQNQNFNGPPNIPRVTTTGVVTDASGAPAPGVRMTVLGGLGGMNQEVKTDDQGKYSITWQGRRGGARRGGAAAAIKYSLLARDVTRNLAVAQDIDDKSTNQDLRLQPGLTLSGTVQETGGKTLSGATVMLIASTGMMGAVLDQQQPGRATDADGAYSFMALPTGLQYSVQASANHHGMASTPQQTPNAQSGEVKLAALVLKVADRQLAGQVQDENGKAVSGAQVQMVGGNGQPTGVLVQTDSKGHFLFKEACEGPAQVYANYNNGFGNVQCQGGDTNVLIKFGANQMGVVGGRQAPPRTTPLIPQAWTMAALKHWPATHKGMIITLISLQVVALAGTAGGVFLMTRKKK